MRLALPAIVSGLRIGTSLVIISVVQGEMLTSTDGLGFLISYHRALFNVGHVYFGIVLVLVIRGFQYRAVGARTAVRARSHARTGHALNSWRAERCRHTASAWMSEGPIPTSFSPTSPREFRIAKVASTPANPAVGVMSGIASLLEPASASAIEFFAHGTTVTTNALCN